ncbi:MAG TPA: cell envelope integrity protein TolA [Burkholderiales bacterium]|nr:cell envelope integrity protein TolA [Burkholderiales bacterium]
MDTKTIYSKTGKGVLEIKNKAGKLAKDLGKVLALIDGKSTVAELIAKSRLSDAEMDRSLLQLSTGGYIKEFSNTSGSAPASSLESSYVDDLDFTSSLAPGKNPYQSAQTEFRQRESADRVKAEQEAKKKREDEERLKKEQALRQARDEAARLGKVEAERKAKEAAALKLREEAERKAKIEAEAMAQTQRDLGKILEAERKALEQAERKKQQEMEREAGENAERRNRENAERQRREDEERRKREEEAARKRNEEEERRRREEEERRRVEEEAARKRQEEEEFRRREEEEARKRKEEEERKRRDEEERKRREEETRRRQEEEARRRQEEEDRKRREEAERKKREEEEQRRRREEEERRQRREEEDRRRAEEDLRREREDDERRQREEEESRGRRGNEVPDEREQDDRRKREAEEASRRREEDDRREREDSDRRRREDEERARSDAAAKSDLPEFDLSGLRSMESQIASEFEKQQEELRRREQEEERRFLEQEEARRAVERAEREEEAKLEAERREAEDRERRERMEREREDREERERKRQQEKELRIKEQEERRVKADLERKRQDEMKIETERKAREEELSRRRKENEERDRKRAEVKSLKRQKAIRTPLERVTPLIIGIVVVVALVVGGIQVIPMNTYVPSIEKLASDHIGEPVTIGSMRISMLGEFSMNLENVKVGTTQDVRIDKVKVSPDFVSLFDEVKVIRNIEVESLSMAQEVLPRLPKWMDAAVSDKVVQVQRVVLKNAKLESRAANLPSFDAKIDLSPEGIIQKAALESVDGKLSVQITPRGGEFDIEVTAGQGWVPPIGPQIAFTDFSAKAVASRNQIRVGEFRALLYGGAAKGSAIISWGGPWSIEGQVSSERVALHELMPVFTRDAKSSGQLETALHYSMAAPDLVTLFDAPRIDGTFTIRKGDLDGVDLVRALQMGGRQNVQGGATRFEEISGVVSVAAGRYQYRNLKLAAGLLSAAGSLEVFASKDVYGRVFVELRSQAAQIRGNFIVDGNLKAVVLKPN